MNYNISVGARGSPLSKKQVQEVFEELCCFFPNTQFEHFWMQTSGDIDQKSSLRDKEKSDFFTKELTDAQKQGLFRISIHSAKDLPEPIPEGICLAALTKGKNPADSLVLPEGKTLETLGKSPKVGTSSKRREEEIKKLIPHAEFVDIRGPIEKRLKLLTQNIVDALVIAECALLRLGLEFLHRIELPGAVAKYQGQLAVLACEEDLEMRSLFAFIDTRI
jgi:hydroxymethylbilane synthase